MSADLDTEHLNSRVNVEDGVEIPVVVQKFSLNDCNENCKRNWKTNFGKLKEGFKKVSEEKIKNYKSFEDEENEEQSKKDQEAFLERRLDLVKLDCDDEVRI